MSSKSDLELMFEDGNGKVSLLDFKVGFTDLKQSWGIETLYSTKRRIDVSVDNLDISKLTNEDLKYSIFLCKPNENNARFIERFNIEGFRTGVRFEVFNGQVRISERGRQLYNNAELLRDGIHYMFVGVSLEALKPYIKRVIVRYMFQKPESIGTDLNKLDKLDYDAVDRLELELKGVYEEMVFLGETKDFNLNIDEDNQFTLPLVLKENRFYNII
ncbi:hypothetical protein COF68_04890 [Bacillus toyonensis]|uniref:hypothetical protein n=1 Tax=Bacillus toyonensis TaxID=155322 RepID=UPI000BFD94F7|nr:hypothetical protein [Bacillus toyonensis]PHE64186.1 hypothetical protein COF68_04890 [Bacillus toyonensis]